MHWFLKAYRVSAHPYWIQLKDFVSQAGLEDKRSNVFKWILDLSGDRDGRVARVFSHIPKALLLHSDLLTFLPQNSKVIKVASSLNLEF